MFSGTMVDFDDGDPMIPTNDLETRVGRLDRKLDALSASVDTRFDALSASVDTRFNAVDAAILEQRQYTKFAHDRLYDAMMAGFGRIDSRFADVHKRFEDVGQRFDRLERKLDQFIDLHLPPKPPAG